MMKMMAMAVLTPVSLVENVKIKIMAIKTVIPDRGIIMQLRQVDKQCASKRKTIEKTTEARRVILIASSDLKKSSLTSMCETSFSLLVKT